MLIEKIPWCSHEGGVYTVHVQATGLRFATGGADSLVKVWGMSAVMDAQREKGGQLLLATLSDHASTVNAVRFSNNGKHLASGADDRMICIYEHRPGPGGATLGGGGASVENWRTRLVLRGHANNVVDLGWSPDDSRLASASLDNAVCIWDASSGQRLHTLDYHTSFVKGLAWDPVGTYLATQAEDKSVVIWRCDDWSVVAAVQAPYANMVTSTFSTRLSWSPDGSFLATGNSYQGASHAAVVIQRGRWNEDREHMLVSGHQGCVVSVAFNPRLFHLPKKGGGAGEVDSRLSCVFMLGAQDKRVSVWAAAQPTPLLVGKRLFRNQVTDLAWSPDGYTALAASSDGTVASFQFSPAELGRAHSREELEAIFQQLYGSAQGAHGKRLFAESADQLALEAAAAKAGSPARAPAAAAALTPAAAPQQGAPVSGAPPVAAAQQVALERAAQPSTQHAMDALSARLSGRMGGGEVQEGFDAPALADRAGRKRIAPEPLGAPPAPAAAATAAARPSSADLMPPPPPVRPPGGQQQEAKRQRPEAGPPAAGSGRATTASGRGAPTTPAVAGGASAGVAGVAQPPVLLRRGDVPAEVTADLGPAPRLFEDPAPSGASVPHRHLRVTNREGAGAAAAAAGGARQQAEVACLQGREVVWSDSLQGAAVAACGTPNFAAVGLADGQLVLYSAAGRHLWAPLKLGAGIAALACGAAWRLLALTTAGMVRVFDVEGPRSLLAASLAPLLEDGCTVLDARLSRQGVPLVTLSSCRAYAWCHDLQGWACVADDSLAASHFTPLLSLPGQGEVSALQAEVLRAAVPRAALPGLQVRGAAAAPGLTRAHLEASLAAALALRSAGEYRRWLAAYARFLAEQADAGRLAEVCAALLGPVGSAAQAWDGDGDGDARMADADGSAAGQAAAGDPGSAWQPCVLGLDKRALLQEVLREMSRNRALQRTTQTYNDALADLQRAQAPAAAPAPTVAAAAAQATAPVPLASAAAAQAAQDGAAAPPAPS